MAKKRRKSRHNRHPGTPSGDGAVRTAERAERQAPPPHRTRQEKKELARQRREQERRRADRKRFVQLFLRMVVISAIGVAAFLWFTRGGDEGPARPATLPGELRTEAPWPANTERLAARVDAIGLPPEGAAQHVHANLRIFVHGERVDVPNGIGVGADEIASLHTHDDTGTIHVESEATRGFTLGEFFDVWGVRLSGTCVGGYCESGKDRLRVFVDGEEVAANRRDTVLDDQEVIVMTFGGDEELPDPIPSTFDFSSVPE
jgi:hypothetical protein